MKTSNTTLAVLAVAVMVAFVFWPDDSFRLVGSDYKPGVLNLGQDEALRDHVSDDYENYHARNTGEEKNQVEENPAMIDSFYSMVTDWYLMGWGHSFHFAHTKTDETHDESIRRHEERIADEIKLKPGMTAVDIGCGVGGPARAIARHSGANIVGITINDYQVNKANGFAKEEGLDHLVNVVQGNFLDMPFEEGTFDAAYAIEATCHAPTLEAVYSEAYRVLKKGGLFASYEWLKTPVYDESNPEHVQAIKDIEYGNALPPLRTFDDVRATAAKLGFEIVFEQDLATDDVDTRPWYHRLDMSGFSYWVTHLTCQITEFLGLSPPGTVHVHEVLLTAVDGLVMGGKQNTFTPMALFVMRKV